MSKQTINTGSSELAGDGESIRSAFDKVNDNFDELYSALGLDTPPLNLGAFEFSGSTISTTDSSPIIIDQATTIKSDLTVGGDVLPETANGGNLGSAAKPWSSLYVSNNTIYIGGNSLGLDNNGNLAWNGSIVAHADGEFIRLDALTDVNAPNPNAGDTLAWMGSQYVNVPLREDRLHSEGDEVVLVGGANPYVTFPAITGGDQLQISGAEVSALAGNLAFSGQTTITLITNGAGTGGIGSQYFTLGADGSLTIPGTIGSEDEFKIEVNVSDSTKYIWRFGEDGELTFPDGTAQSSAGISASSTNTLTNKTINIQAGQGNVFQIQGNSITSYSGSGAVLALTSMPTFSGMNINNSSLSIDGGSGSFYANTAFADGAGTIHKAGVYKSANNANNALFTFGANGAGTMSVVMDGSLFIGSALPANNGGLNTDYGGWLVVQAGGKFGGDVNTLGNFILNSSDRYIVFGDGSIQSTAADFGYLDLDKDTIKGTAGYQYTFATDGYFTASTSSESPNYFFVAYNTTNANIAAGWTVVGGTANTTVSSVTYPVAGYPGVIRVNLTAAASSTSGFYPVTVTSPDRLRVEIQPNPGTSDKFAFTTSGLTFPDTTVQTTAYTGTANNIENEGDVSIRVNLTDSTTHTWQFGEDGDFKIPGNLIHGGDTINPTESINTAGNPLTLRAGDSETQNGGNLILRGGNTVGSPGTPRNGGYVVVRAGETVTGNGGYAELFGGTTVTGNGGQAYVTAGSATTGDGGPVEIRAGNTVTGDGGDVIIESGEAVTGTAGNINIAAKGTITGDGGNINLTAGTTITGNGGDINLTAGDNVSGGDPGTIRLRTVNATVNKDWTFGFDGSLTLPGILKVEDGVHEQFQTKADATGVVTHDCSLGHIFYHTSPDANWTVNLTNLNLSSGYATAVTLIIVQGGTGYYPSAVQIGGAAQTLNWQGNATPTPSTNRTDVVTLSIINNSGTYTVLGQLTGF